MGSPFTYFPDNKSNNYVWLYVKKQAVVWSPLAYRIHIQKCGVAMCCVRQSWDIGKWPSLCHSSKSRFQGFWHPHRSILLHHTKNGPFLFWVTGRNTNFSAETEQSGEKMCRHCTMNLLPSVSSQWFFEIYSRVNPHAHSLLPPLADKTLSIAGWTFV